MNAPHGRPDGARALVRIRGLTKTYVRGQQRIEVLHGIDLEIPDGDFVALMGPSGSGKTTLLNLIGGLDTPTTGELTVDGKRIETLGSMHWRTGAPTPSASSYRIRKSAKISLVCGYNYEQTLSF